MTNAKKIAFAAVAVCVAVLVACSDRRPDSGVPTAPKLVRDQQGNVVMGACTTIDQLNTLAAQVFGSGSPNVNSVLGKLDNLQKKVAAGNVADARDQANNIVAFVKEKAADGRLAGSSATIDSFIAGVLCFAGLSPDTFLIQPTDQPQVITSGAGTSAVSLPGNPVGTPTLLTITTLDPNAPSGIVTDLDQYPTVINITVSSPIVGAADVAVCPVGTIDPTVRARLRLGHQKTTGFEITPPPANQNFLTCGTSTQLGAAASSRLPGWLRSLASLVIPKPLYAWRQDLERGGGVGGSVTEFSPFDAVDPDLAMRGGGVGGSVTEFKKSGTTSPKFSPQASTKSSQAPGAAMVPGLGTAALALDGCATQVDTQVSANCRPTMTIVTPTLGTLMHDVPVDWVVTSGGGKIAAFDGQSCGADVTSLTTMTNASAFTSICFRVGHDTGTGNNVVTATPRFGGNAPAGVTFIGPQGTGTHSLVYSVSGTRITPTAALTNATPVQFSGGPNAGTGTCSNALTPAFSYAKDGSALGGAPTDVGTYDYTVTCGDGNNVYNTVSDTKSITISTLVPTVTVTCTTVEFNGSAQTPCSADVSALGGPVAGATVTWAYTDNTNAGTGHATASYAGGGNYAAATGSGSFTISKAASATAVSCPTSVTYTGTTQTPCTAAATGVGGLSTAVAPVGYTDNTNAGTASASATYAGDANHNGSSGSATFTIDKASSATSVTCSDVTYNGAAQTPCSANATGAGGLSQAVAIVYTSNTNAGTAGASATFAGDANHTGSANSATFSIGKATSATNVTCPASVTYNGAAQTPCSAGVTGAGGLSQTPAITYAGNTGAGTATASASFAGDANHDGSADSKSFTINKSAATATAGSATINFGSAVPSIPCSVSGLIVPPDAGAVTCTTSVPPVTLAGNYTTSPVISPAVPANYAMLSITGTLTVAAYKQVGCFSSPIFNVMPDTKSAQKKGSNLPVKCTLTTPQGAAVTNATGNITVTDVGVQATTPPSKVGTVVLQANNVFKFSSGGNYAYGLDTSPAAFIVGHYYYVTATWNDGSKTEGWFLLK